MKLSIDPGHALSNLFHDHVQRAKYDMDAACDGETTAATISRSLFPEKCIWKGNLLSLTIAWSSLFKV